jgi:hypothetical protein
MADMTTRPSMSDAEKAGATSFLWGHTGADPSTDKVIPTADILTKNTADEYEMRDSAGALVGKIKTDAAYAGTGTASSGAPRAFYGTLTPSGDDSAHLTGRAIVGASLFSHRDRDESTFVSTTTGAYATSDSAYSVSGSTHYNHFRGFQFRMSYGGSGLVDEINGFGHQPVMTSGTAGNVYGVHVFDTTRSGGASITGQQTAFFSELLTGAAGGNYLIYGSNNSYMGGTLQIAGSLSGVTTIAASGQATLGAVHATGNNAAFSSGGGVYMAKAVGASGYGGIQAYTDAGGTANGFNIQSAGGVTIIGGPSPSSSAKLQVNGDIFPVGDNTSDLGSASFRFNDIFLGNAPTVTSDERKKCDIDTVPTEWLDAWGSVEWSRYKFVGGKRWHIGLVAQRVHAAFAAIGVDAFEIGLCSYNSWEETTIDEMHAVTYMREVEEDRLVPYTRQIPDRTKKGGRWVTRMVDVVTHVKEPVTIEQEYEVMEPSGKKIVMREAGDIWGLRYDECFAMEAAWQRRELAEIKRLATDI